MNRIQFSQIPDKLDYAQVYKSVLSSYHSAIIDYAIQNYDGTRLFRKDTIDLINIVSSMVYSHDNLPEGWPGTDPFEPADFWETRQCDEELISEIYIKFTDVDWDVDVSSKAASQDVSKLFKKNEYNDGSTATDYSQQPIDFNKSDLSIQPPIFPKFDYSKVWMSGNVDDVNYTIYTSLPEVPTCQQEISVSTDLNKMRTPDLMNLFPPQFIQTRNPALYKYDENLDKDDILGLIIPIDDYSEEEIKQNIIEYPHIYRLYRIVDGKFSNFYTSIEIDGELHSILDVWDELPASKVIPKKIDYIKEYVTRKYLMDRDLQHKKYKYPLFGDLSPFLTLFTTPEQYADWGYIDAADLARHCVLARVAYKQSRNPVIRRLNEVNA